MKSKFIILCFTFALIESSYGQSSNMRNAGICYGIIMASANARLVQAKDIPEQGMDVIRKYDQTRIRIEKKISECKGKNNDVKSLKLCEEKILGNKSDIDFLSGMDFAHGWIISGQAMGRKDVAIFKIKELCTGVN
jgi:hypothetical protein